ncbi:hypothetical protein ACFWOB_46275 [Streptomyces sp. NPDC058420]|uniref:hypothetical protein n=1 Tax=Streptomyces sp. NPDC058420 TaxID=3346489 RepID=UPI00364C72D7
MTDMGPTEEETPDGLLGWCLAANVARETSHGDSGLDIQHGTKHFCAGTLLWLPPVRWDPGCAVGTRWAGTGATAAGTSTWS